MKNRLSLWFVVLGIALLGALSYYLYDASKPQYNWEESGWKKRGYDERSEQPYGSSIAHRLLQNYFPGKKLTDIKKRLAEELPLHSTDAPSNYVFVGEAMFMDSSSTQRLLAYVAAGNTALISSKTIPFDLMTFVYFNECPQAYWSDYEMLTNTFAQLSLRTPALPDSSVRFFYAQQNKPLQYRWHFIPQEIFCDSLPHCPLGYLNGEWVNFAKFPHGKGIFLLHTTPIAFSNFSLLRPDVQSYAAGIFSHLTEGDIYWDAASRVPESVGRRRNGTNSQLPTEHPLSYVLRKPPLAWAWYLLVGLSLIWVFFRAKRRQRPIPVIPPNENASFEFINTIANLHFRKKNYQGLCVQSMRHFLTQLRERYGLSVKYHSNSRLLQIDDVFFQKLAVCSELPEAEGRNVFRLYENTQRYQPTEEMAMELYLTLENYLRAAR